MSGKGARRGFSLLELLLVVALLTVVMGVVVKNIDVVQKRYRAEENKLDITQSGREFVDQFVRDLHQAGFPNAAMYQPGVLMNPAANDQDSAVGLVFVSATSIRFEGDVDGDGSVDSVQYTLQSTGGQCPCSLQRSQVQKVNATAPLSQTPTLRLAMEGVVNSGGAGGSGPNGALDISGTTRFTNGSSATNNTVYAAYRPQAVFAAYDADGVEITLPVDVTSPLVLARIKTIRVTVNVLSPYFDMQTGARPVVSMRAVANI